MRLIALSIVILAGALMAGAGVIANALPSARQYTDLDGWGMAVVGLGCLLFVIEWVRGKGEGRLVEDAELLPGRAG